MIKLVAFDWNGTLIADTMACCKAGNEVLNSLGIKDISLGTFRNTIKIPLTEHFNDLGADVSKVLKNPRKYASIFEKNYETRVQKVRTRKNARRLLQMLSKRNINSIIFSNYSYEKIIHQLNRLEIDKYFDMVLAEPELKSVYTKRHKMDKLTDYIISQKINHNQLLIIGDTEEEIDIAKALKAYSVAITSGFYSTHRLKAAKPDYLISNLFQLIPIIETLNG